MAKIDLNMYTVVHRTVILKVGGELIRLKLGESESLKMKRRQSFVNIVPSLIYAVV